MEPTTSAGSTSFSKRQPADRGHRGDRWKPHRGWSLLVRLVVALVPLVAGLVVGQQLALALGPPSGPLLTGLWWAAVLAATVATVLVVEHGARRFLPLSMLLRLSLLFPDRAPSRFRVALRASTARRAERALLLAGDDVSASAQAEAALALVAALHAHDRRTRGHSERVRALTVMVGRQLGLEQEDLDRLEWAGLLHDIGKLRVPATILNKAGPPDDEEWMILRRHPGDGGILMAPLSAWLGEWVHGVDQHHEYHDGSGYPRRLAGAEITLAGRIVAVTDAFETMTAARSYKRPMPVAQARAELVSCAGTQFDPAVVRAVLALSLPRLIGVLGPVAALMQVPAAAPFASAAADLHGVLAAAVVTTPRVLATGALVLGTFGAGHGATVAGADAQVVGIAVGDHATPFTGAPAASAGAGAGDTEQIVARSDASPNAAGTDVGRPGIGGFGSGRTDTPGRPDAPTGGPAPGPPPSAVSTGSDGPPSTRPPHPPGPQPTTTVPPTTVPPTTVPPPLPPAGPPPTSPPPAPHPQPPGLPAAAAACLNGGWVALGFPNQGQCISARLHG